MVRGIVTKGAFYWLRAPRSSLNLRTDEWILATIRLLLGVCFLIAIARPATAYNLKSYVIVAVAYTCYGLIVAAALYYLPTLPPFFQVYIHCLDIIWTAQLACMAAWPALVLAVLFLIMISTAFRWGFWEAVLTSVVFYALLLAGHDIYNSYLLSSLDSIDGPSMPMEMLPYFGMMCMIGLLAEAKAVRSEDMSLNRIIGQICIKSGPEQALQSLAMEGLQAYGATQFLIAIHEKGRNRFHLHRIISPNGLILSSEMEATGHPEYLFPEPGLSVRLAIGRSAGALRFRCSALINNKLHKSYTDCHLPEAFLAAHPFRRLLATAYTMDNDWIARVYAIDPSRFFGGTAGLRVLAQRAGMFAPVLHDLFRINHLTRKAKMAAGSQMARELHDGIIQSLAAINMQIETMKQQSGEGLGQDENPLDRIQRSIRKEIVSLRDLTQQLRSMELDSSNVLSFLAGMAVKFQAEHGIATRFVSEVHEVPLPSHVCVEMARITQEALVNVRKHSNAKEALVRLNRRNGSLVLSILDNGRGFGFSGQRSHEELQLSGQGPRILMERAVLVGGKVAIESIENSGARIEVVIPCA